jgi:hypothetical protein
MRCSCGITFERPAALITHLTDDHMDSATEEFREEWLAA